MNWINYDIYKALVAWLFMLLSGILLLSSFGENGEVTFNTFFYFMIMILLGLFLLITIIRHREIVAGIDDIVQDTLEIEDAHEAAIIDNIDQKYVNPLREEEEFLEEVLPNGSNSDTLQKFAGKVLKSFAKKVDSVQGLMYLRDPVKDTFSKIADYAFYSDKPLLSFHSGETLPGQVAKNKKPIIIDNVPEGYMTVLSGLGSSSPQNLIIFPLLYRDETIAVVELASFRQFSEREENFIAKVAITLGNELGKSKKKEKQIISC